MGECEAAINQAATCAAEERRGKKRRLRLWTEKEEKEEDEGRQKERSERRHVADLRQAVAGNSSDINKSGHLPERTEEELGQGQEWHLGTCRMALATKRICKLDIKWKDFPPIISQLMKFPPM